MSLKKVLFDVLEDIEVSSSEVKEIKKVVDSFVSSLKARGLKAVVGGSFAKGTYVLKEKQDVDVFVVFDSEVEISSFGRVLSRMKLPGKLAVVHGSRDYYQIDCGFVVLEVVPVVKVKDIADALNITDVSLSHVKYIVGEVKKNPRIVDDIKLAKVFCRANGCYGAEGYVRGFSGYSLEVLVIYFGGFVKFLKGISKKVVIDPRRYFRNSNEVMRELNSSKLDSPIVLVDPTYKYRNVCAGLGLETYEKFLEVARKFLKKPSKEFFVSHEFDVEEFRRRASGRFVEVDLSTDRQEGDIAGTKMKKFFDFFVRELERRGQIVLGKEFVYSGVGKDAKGYLIVREKEEIEVQGPSVGLSDAVKAFKKVNKDWFEKKKYLYHVEKVSVEGVFEKCLESSEDMGAFGKLIFPS